MVFYMVDPTAISLCRFHEMLCLPFGFGGFRELVLLLKTSPKTLRIAYL